MENVFLLTGSNMGSRENFLELALYQLKKSVRIIEISSIYESEPWGYKSDMPYLNQCIKAESELKPHDLLSLLKRIEKDAGRQKRTDSYEDRPLDIDILFYGDLVLNTKELIIPHPRLHLRAFTLVPLNEIASGFVHPALKKTTAELLKECPDQNLPHKVK